jgi:hypothetical protein
MTPYAVNEREPEAFIPYTSGRVVPLSQTSAGGGVTIQQLNINTDIDLGLVLREIGWRLANR